MVLIRLAKVAMIASLAAYAFIVAYDNIVDYQSNYEFVRHVLSMDTTFHGNALMHRAISNESIWSLAYALIIAMEGATALLLVVGALVLVSRTQGARRGLQPLKGLGGGRIRTSALASGFSASW